MKRSIRYILCFFPLVTGLSEDEADLSARSAAFGRNEIPPKPPKTFFRLMFEALQDITLVILIICAVISFALSFYHPSEESFEATLRPSKKDYSYLN
jgi:magnesium-transporting ATPase (P-type)